MLELIRPDWPVPSQVHAVITTRAGGCSEQPFASLNLGDHVGDDPERVRQNRRLLSQELGLPGEPYWLRQVHGCEVAQCGIDVPGAEADAAIAMRPNQVCAVLTADCLPLLLTNRQGNRVAAVHAGWRGLAAGVIEAAIERLGQPGDELLAWLGPAIGPRAFEVGDEVREAFLAHDAQAESAFLPARPGHWLANIYQLARLRLRARGLGYVGGGDYCTVTDSHRFYSYRRDGVTGRMASLIWFDS